MPRYGFEVGQSVFVVFHFRNVNAESKVTAIEVSDIMKAMEILGLEYGPS